MERSHVEQMLNYGSVTVSHRAGLKEFEWGFRHSGDGCIATIQCTPFYSIGVQDTLLYRQRWDMASMSSSFADIKKILDGSVRLEPTSSGPLHLAGPFFVVRWFPRIDRDSMGRPQVRHHRCRVVCVRCGWEGKDRSTNVARFMINDADSHACEGM